MILTINNKVTLALLNIISTLILLIGHTAATPSSAHSSCKTLPPPISKSEARSPKGETKEDKEFGCTKGESRAAKREIGETLIEKSTNEGGSLRFVAENRKNSPEASMTCSQMRYSFVELAFYGSLAFLLLL
ncbi:hypothetical protein AAC387_Pa02g0893 [Persea americana]